MMSSNSLSPKPSGPRCKKTGIAFLLLGFLGFLDAAYLVIERYAGSIPPCSVTHGCAVVLTSQYSAIFGIPVALFGALYYSAITILAAVYLVNGSYRAILIASWIVCAGAVLSLWFVHVQLFILHSICVYCMTSAVDSATLFVFAVRVIKKTRFKK